MMLRKPFLAALLLSLPLACSHAPPRPAAEAAQITKPLILPAESAQPVSWRAFVLGDAGWPGQPKDEAVRALQALAARGDAPAVVLTPGDLFYERGLPADCAAARARVENEYVRDLPGLDVVGVAGNHDHGDVPGHADPALVRRDAYFDCAFTEAVAPEVGWSPAACGCVARWKFPTGDRLAGSRDLGPFTLVAFDSQEALVDPAPVAKALAAALEAVPRDRRLLVMTHHPFESLGPHGGPVAHSSQDLASPAYQAYLAAVRPVLAEYRDRIALLIFGHEHTTQYFPGKEGFPAMLVSGAGSKLSPVRPAPPGVFAKGDSAGITELDLLGDGTLRVTLVTDEEPAAFTIAR
jgi:3',5'-cyclic AMP phosphodiesterase CpdA